MARTAGDIRSVAAQIGEGSEGGTGLLVTPIYGWRRIGRGWGKDSLDADGWLEVTPENQDDMRFFKVTVGMLDLTLR